MLPLRHCSSGCCCCRFVGVAVAVLRSLAAAPAIGSEFCSWLSSAWLDDLISACLGSFTCVAVTRLRDHSRHCDSGITTTAVKCKASLLQPAVLTVGSGAFSLMMTMITVGISVIANVPSVAFVLSSVAETMPACSCGFEGSRTTPNFCHHTDQSTCSRES